MKNTEQLTLEDLAPYLPYELKFISYMDKPYDEYGKQPQRSFNGINQMFGYYCLITNQNNDAYPIKTCKPIMYPLSMLTKMIVHNEEGIVPMLELERQNIRMGVIINQSNVDLLPHLAMKKLHEWHFWTGDQSYFDKGLIIDKSKS